MLREQDSGRADPIASVLGFFRALERALGDLEASGAARATATRVFDVEAPGYRDDLEQALFPLLKRRLRGSPDDAQERASVAIGRMPGATDEEEAALQRELFLIEGNLQQLDTAWQRLRPRLSRASAAETADFAEGWREHMERMEHRILPQLHARLARCDLEALAEAMARHRGRAWESLAEDAAGR